MTAPVRDTGVIAMQVVAAVLVVAVVVTGFLHAHVPEVLGCRIDQTLAQVTGDRSSTCPDGEVVAAPAPTGRGIWGDTDRPDDGPTTPGGLTGETYGGTWVAVVPDSGDPHDERRCAIDPGGTEKGSRLCLDGRGAGPDGGEVLQRCRDVRTLTPTTQSSTEVCRGTQLDARPVLTTTTDMPFEHWCQPVQTEESNGDVLIRWACLAPEGDVYSCESLVSERDFVATPDGFASLWPRRCPSRTFGPGVLDCGDPVANLAGCTIPAIAGQSAKDLHCVLFLAPADQTDRSHLVNRPMHCAATIAAPVTGGPPAVTAPIWTPTGHLTRSCAALPLRHRGRTLTGPRIRVADLLCGGGPPGLVIDISSLLTSGSTDSDSVIDDVSSAIVDEQTLPASGVAQVGGPEDGTVLSDTAQFVGAMAGAIADLLPDLDPAAALAAIPPVVIVPGSVHHATTEAGAIVGPLLILGENDLATDDLAHELGHILLTAQGLQDVDWQVAGLHEGVADVIGELLAHQVGVPFTPFQPLLPNGDPAPVDFADFSPDASPHQNGVPVRYALTRLRALMAAQPGVTLTPDQVDSLLLQLIMLAAHQPIAGQGVVGFAQGLANAAPALGIPAQLVHLAFETFGLQVDSSGGTGTDTGTGSGSGSGTCPRPGSGGSGSSGSPGGMPGGEWGGTAEDVGSGAAGAVDGACGPR